ncbi:MAG: hypothetical protein IJP00_05665 [Firmicutes bacterium]|nr:hypothetical protein [Bacillota bacterium]
MKYKVGVITLSDKGAAGLRTDESGPLIKEILDESGFCQVCETVILPDDADKLKEELVRMTDKKKYALVLTTGGTGLSPRDNTPEATLAIADRNVPGIAEYMRYKSFEITPKAMLSRAVSVTRGQTLIINLPGSPKAVRENLGFIIPALEHGLEILTGQGGECAEPVKKHKDVSFLDRESRARIDAGCDQRALCQKKFKEDVTLDCSVSVGDVVEVNGKKVEITQVGKKCYSSCQLFKEEGPCFLAKKVAFGKWI